MREPFTCQSPEQFRDWSFYLISCHMQIVTTAPWSACSAVAVVTVRDAEGWA